jgi:hypothetical protein
MIQHLTHYVTALLFLTACAVVYHNVITPSMQPPAVSSVPPKVVTVGQSNDALTELFPAGSWQRGTCKQLQSSGGMLLFANWEQISDSQWKLWPVTVVIGRGMSGDESQDPVIIDASGGAEIIFTESLDVLSGGAPPIRRGRMIGPVHIRRPGSDGSGKSLSIRTANVGIDNQKIWTTESIEMDMGEAKMVGRDLTIHYSGASAAAAGGQPVLDRMELIYLDELVMPLSKGGLLNRQSGQQARLSLQCGGRVEYDFALDELSLRESVSLVHQVDAQPADSFHCDTLQLKLRDPTNDLIRRDTPIDWLVSIVASGSPAHAVLSSFDAEVAAGVIEFNAVTGLITANGGKTRTGVRVRRGGIDASLSQLAYQFDPKQPDAIGSIDVQGAGIVHLDDPTIPLVLAKWRDGFQLQPTSVTTAENFNSKVELTVDGDVYAKLTDGGEFHANSVKGVMKPKLQPSVVAGKKRTTLVPEHFQASGDVRIDTSALAAETQTLVLDFVPPEGGAAPASSSAGSDPAGLNPLRQWVTQPGGGKTTVDPVARPRPIIRGDAIGALLRLDTKGVSAKDMSVRGSITVTHLIKAGGQLLPARLTGERLRLIDNGGGDDILQLEGGNETPARFDMGDGFFVGPMIQIWPAENLVRINAAGEFQMPTAALPTSLTASSPGSTDSQSGIEWTSAPHCRWNGEMIFDGRTAVLTEGVEIKASLVDGTDAWELQMQGDRLQVDMRQDVQVRDINSIKNASIERVSLLGSQARPVLVQAIQRAADGVPQAKHVLHAPKLTLTPAVAQQSGAQQSGTQQSGAGAIAGGRLVGEGLGWYRAWLTPSKKNPLGSFAGANAEEKPDAQGDRKLTGMHLIFNDSMQANLAAKTLEFLRGVRVGVRPVDGMDEYFDAAVMDAISMGESTLDCDRLRLMVAPGFSGRFGAAPTPWEMEAVSGVVFRTRNDSGLLEGTASRAAYASAKDLFTVEGAPNRAAIFRKTQPDGQPGPEGAVRTMTIRPSTMEALNLKLEYLNLATPPSGSIR